MSKHSQECTAPERACARRPKYIGRVSPASGQAQKSQPMVVNASRHQGGKADTLFAGKAEWTAKVAIER